MNDPLSFFVDKATYLKQIGTEQVTNFVSDPNLIQPQVQEKWYKGSIDFFSEIGSEILSYLLERVGPYLIEGLSRIFSSSLELLGQGLVSCLEGLGHILGAFLEGLFSGLS